MARIVVSQAEIDAAYTALQGGDYTSLHTDGKVFSGLSGLAYRFAWCDADRESVGLPPRNTGKASLEDQRAAAMARITGAPVATTTAAERIAAILAEE